MRSPAGPYRASKIASGISREGYASLMRAGRALLVLVLMVASAGCQPAGPTAKQKPVTLQSIALQPGDVAGLQPCGASGDVEAVLQDEKSTNPYAYDVNSTEWAQWKRQGASDAYFAAYGRTAADCDALSPAGTGAPSGGLVISLIVKFKSDSKAEWTYGAASALLGFGPRDIEFIKLVGGIITTGSDTGLGPRSVIGSGSVPGTTFYFAFWQNKAFDSYVYAYDLASDLAQGAADDVNRRIR